MLGRRIARPLIHLRIGGWTGHSGGRTKGDTLCGCGWCGARRVTSATTRVDYNSVRARVSWRRMSKHGASHSRSYNTARQVLVTDS